MVDTVHGTFPGDFCRVSKSKIRGPKVEIKPSLNRIHMCLKPGGSPPRDGVVRANSAVKDRVAGLENWGHSGDCYACAACHPQKHFLRSSDCRYAKWADAYVRSNRAVPRRAISGGW